MKSKAIPDQAITASSTLNQYQRPEMARLDNVKEGNISGGWIPLYNNLGQWIQIDLISITKITAVATQGLQELDYWVKEYSITYSVNGGPYISYKDGQVPYHFNALILRTYYGTKRWFPFLCISMNFTTYLSSCPKH